MTQVKLALIGGSGFYGIGPVTAGPERIDTPYGPVTVTYQRLAGQDVIFLPRHSTGHVLPPHRINYRANIWALQKLGVQGIIATFAAGSLRPELLPGQLVLLNSFLDFTSGRESTFFSGEDGRVVHTDVTYPYCPLLSEALRAAGGDIGLSLAAGCYVCVNGPRYETAAEVRAFAMLGGDVVGMTGVPEVVLARELDICYAGLGLVTNPGAGLAAGKLSHQEVLQVMTAGLAQIREVLAGAIDKLADRRCADC